uniref:Protein tiptop n=1 Tax=Echinococcus granulosus TaxID=6210 RepID=A0A068WKC1_ECHGR|nr:protein tiptop [Echinococcus granulosus]
MNVLSSTNPSLTSAPTNSSPRPPSSSSSSPPGQAQTQSSTKTTPPESPMTIGMTFSSTASKTRPLDLSASDRITATTAANLVSLECPKLIKIEEENMEREEKVSTINEISAVEAEKPLKVESEEKIASPGEKSFKSVETAISEHPRLEEVSAQLKTLMEFFKTLTNSSTSLDATVASLHALIGKKSDKDAGSDAGSLEALHQLGWQLISLGRNASRTTHSFIPTSTGPSWMPGSRQQPPPPPPPPPPPSQSQSQQPLSHVQHPQSSLSGISMRGNQKYSAFYQHTRKHQVIEEAESLRQSVATPAPPFHRLGFPSRRVNGPALPSHTKGHFSNPSGGLEPSLKPSVISQRLQSEITSPPRSRETAFLCSCGDDFESLYGFTLHMRDTGHKPRSSQPERDIPKLVRGQDMWINSETEQTREILRCMRCNQSFRSLPELTMHMMKTSHYSEIVYSDAGRNLLASQTFSSVAERNRSGSSMNTSSWNPTGLKTSSSSMSLKRPIRGSVPSQNGLAMSSEPTKNIESSTIEKKVNGHPEAPHIGNKSSRLEEPQKCERPASSYEMHVVKPSPKPAASPEALSCPSDLQRSAASSPRNEGEKQEQKYLNSPTSSRENTSPRASEEEASRRGCTDSVIRQIESFVEKSLPKSSTSSPVASRTPTWQQRQQMQGLIKPAAFGRCNLSPLTETDTSRSTPDKCVQRKRRFSSGSSNSMATSSVPTANASTEVSAEKRPLLASFSAEVGGPENPLSSLQKLVETTHQSGTGLKSPIRPFSQTSEISPVPSNQSNDVEGSGGVKTAPSTAEAVHQQTSIVAALSALQNLMSKVSTPSPTANSSKQPQTSPPNLDFLLPSNGENDTANWMGLLSTFLNATKQSDTESKRSETSLSISNLSSSKMFEQPSAVFPAGGFEFSAVAKAQPLSVHMNPPTMTSAGPSIVANITKKAKCHFCGKPFANKGQVRLHISKNKCPCLLQQSALAKPSGGATSASTIGSQVPDKHGLPFPYPGFPPGAADLSRFFSPPPPPTHHQQQPAQQTTQPPSSSQPSVPQQSTQQKSTDTKPHAEAAALAAILRHFNVTQTGRPAGLKPTDVLASLARPTETNTGNVPASSNPLFSIFFPSTNIAAAAPPPPPPPPPPPTQPVDTAGLTPEQKALFLFAQAMVSLAVGASSTTTSGKIGEEMTQPQPPPPPPPPPPQLPAYPPLTSLLQNFNITPTPPQEVAVNPETLESYLSAIRHLASLGNAAALAAATVGVASTASMTGTNTTTTTTATASMVSSNSLTGGESVPVATKEAESQ